jgi:biopolymer transport protein ExbD
MKGGLAVRSIGWDVIPVRPIGLVSTLSLLVLTAVLLEQESKSKEDGAEIALPFSVDDGGNPDPIGAGPIAVVLTRSSSFEIEGALVQRTAFTRTLGGMLAARRADTVLFDAYDQATVEQVLAAMALVRAAGADRIFVWPEPLAATRTKHGTTFGFVCGGVKYDTSRRVDTAGLWVAAAASIAALLAVFAIRRT